MTNFVGVNVEAIRRFVVEQSGAPAEYHDRMIVAMVRAFDETLGTTTLVATHRLQRKSRAGTLSNGQPCAYALDEGSELWHEHDHDACLDAIVEEPPSGYDPEQHARVMRQPGVRAQAFAEVAELRDKVRGEVDPYAAREPYGAAETFEPGEVDDEHPEPPLAEGVYRTARKAYRCTTADEFLPSGRRNHNHASRVDGCTGTIMPADRYVEYVGEAGAYQSGTRYCLPCGVATWARSDDELPPFDATHDDPPNTF